MASHALQSRRQGGVWTGRREGEGGGGGEGEGNHRAEAISARRGLGEGCGGEGDGAVDSKGGKEVPGTPDGRTSDVVEEVLAVAEGSSEPESDEALEDLD